MSNPFNLFFSYTGTVQFVCKKSLDTALSSIYKLISDQKYSSSDEVLFRPRLKGKISKSEVILHRVVPAFGNYLTKPIFYGKFVEKNGALVLKGSFLISRFSRTSFLIGTLILFLLECLFISSMIFSSDQLQTKLLFVCFIPVTYSLVVAVHLLLKRLNRGDVKWISNEIESALQ
jgi:hypothetical protein